MVAIKAEKDFTTKILLHVVEVKIGVKLNG